MCLALPQAVEKIWERTLRAQRIVRPCVFTFRICECFLWIRLGHVHENVPRANFTAAQEFCLQMVSKSLPHLSPDFITCIALKNYQSFLKYLLPLFCQDPDCDPLSKSVLRACLSSRIYSTLIPYQHSWHIAIKLEDCIS